MQNVNNERLQIQKKYGHKTKVNIFARRLIKNLEIL